MTDILLPALIGFFGVLLGSLSSILTIFVQTRIQDKRERTKLIVETALSEYKELIDVAKCHKGNSSILPLTGSIHWYLNVFKMVDNGNFNEENLRTLFKNNKKIISVFENNSENR
ncbi:MAG: hypothetical protein JXQ65_02525 [Candidatus Marinimicrobia bacterium]|nr:hypothetical protein [Candidatus Neomarinimicrobiota bacterium]